VRIAQARHRGMPDLIVNGNRLVWDGRKYPDNFCTNMRRS